MEEFTEEHFIRLIKKSMEDASSDLRAYKIRLAAFALLGYALVFSILATLVILIVGTIGISFLNTSLALSLVNNNIIFLIIFAIWALLKATVVKFDSPDGYILKRKQHPTFFSEIDQLSNYLDTLKIHHVSITGGADISIFQRPRFGIFGSQKNNLCIGLQLLLSLSPSEMRPMLAHEFSHLSGKHNRFSNWIYRVRTTWQRTMIAYEYSNSFGAGLMERFFDWYTPRFLAYSFALARSNEYRADLVAAELTSSEFTAKTLINAYTRSSYINNDYWDIYHSKADYCSKPDISPFIGLAAFIKNKPAAPDLLLQLLDKKMKELTQYSDILPSLKDRVEALTPSPLTPDIPDSDAAEAWLGDRLQHVIAFLDQQWHEEYDEPWLDRYEYASSSKTTLEDYRKKDSNLLSDDELWERAILTSEFDNDELALPLFLCFHERHPDSAGSAYHIGRILLHREDELGLHYLRIAFSGYDTLDEAAQWGYNFLMDSGRAQEAKHWQADAEAAADVNNAAYLERNEISTKDDFEPAKIDKDTLDKIKQALLAHKNVSSAWLGQKILKHYTNDPVYVLALYPKGLYWSSNRVTDDVANSIGIDSNIYVVSLRGETSGLGKKIKRTGDKIL